MSMPPAGGFAQQRVIKDGDTGRINSFQPVAVTGWASDATWPGTAASAGLRVVGEGSAVATCTVNITTAGQGGHAVSLRINGAIVDQKSGSTAGPISLTAPARTFADGDVVELWCNSAAAFNGPIIAASGTWIDVTPV